MTDTPISYPESSDEDGPARLADLEASYESLRGLDAAGVRRAIRAGAYRGHTAGLAPGRLQANLAVLPEAHAEDFLQFCQLNPRPCPLVGLSKPGRARIPELGSDLDLRYDLPGYLLYRQGVLAETRTDIADLWSADLVAFALGCSFTFERALEAAGIELWHIAHNKTVPMYRSNLMTRPVGVFGGGAVVSMRALKESDLERAVEISSRYPQAHGAPLHIGSPAEIGIAELARPDWGDPAPVGPGEVPVFWACGVTPQNAILDARLPLAITHKPGQMLITDRSETAPLPALSTMYL